MLSIRSELTSLIDNTLSHPILEYRPRPVLFLDLIEQGDRNSIPNHAPPGHSRYVPGYHSRCLEQRGRRDQTRAQFSLPAWDTFELNSAAGPELAFSAVVLCPATGELLSPGPKSREPRAYWPPPKLAVICLNQHPDSHMPESIPACFRTTCHSLCRPLIVRTSRLPKGRHS